MYENTFPHKRFKLTFEFLQKYVSTSETILDLGVENPFSKLMSSRGYQVENTKGEDLDLDTSTIEKSSSDVVTAFEICEHMLSPLTSLSAIKSDKLVASVPLKLWFSKAYQNKTDKWDRHYHEFEDWQFDWLLEKAGWKIIDRQKFTHPIKKLGFRPILRWFVPRYYLIYAERIK